MKINKIEKIDFDLFLKDLESTRLVLENIVRTCYTILTDTFTVVVIPLSSIIAISVVHVIRRKKELKFMAPKVIEQNKKTIVKEPPYFLIVSISFIIWLVVFVIRLFNF